MELDEEVVMSLASRESEVVMDARARLAQLWTKFESRANTLVEELELQVGGGGTSGKSSSHSDTRKQVEMYLKSKMESYHMGEFIIRKK